jgi:hypothetical protein
MTARPSEPHGTTRPAEPRLRIERDVNLVYKRGLSRSIGRGDLPALIALAEAHSPGEHSSDSDYYASIVEQLLHRAIDVATQSLQSTLSVTTAQRRKGLQELFDVGTGDDHIEGLGQRLAYTALAWEFKTGESLRRTTRTGERLCTVVCRSVTDALYVLAQQIDFAYEDDSLVEEQSVPWLMTVSDRPLLPDGNQALKVFYVGRALYEELAAFSIQGFDAVVQNQERTPTICSIARLATSAGRSEHDNLTATGLEQTFIWAIQRTPSTINDDGAAALFGLRKGRGEDSQTRLKMAALLHGYNDSDTFVYSQKLAAILTYTRNQFLRLTAEMRYWPKTPDSDNVV